jgi:ribosomal protein L11 methyltransferase
VIRLAVRVRREDAEIALAELVALAPGGVEEVDLGDRIEYAIYGAPGELPELPDLEAAAGDALVEIRTSEVADDWSERWKAFHTPVELPGLRVRPPWFDGDATDIVIDPGQAFGTGGHETTRLCLELLLDLDPTRTFADLGCGSGVLAIAAARRGFGDIVALDFDPLAVDATIENARVNGVELEARRWDLRDEPAPEAETVAANLLRPLLLELRFAAEPPRTLIASGLLAREADEAADHFAAVHGLIEKKRLERGDWAALLLSR